MWHCPHSTSEWTDASNAFFCGVIVWHSVQNGTLSEYSTRWTPPMVAATPTARVARMSWIAPRRVSARGIGMRPRALRTRPGALAGSASTAGMVWVSGRVGGIDDVRGLVHQAATSFVMI